MEDRTFIFFHHEGQFLVPGSINSFQLKDSREVKQLALQISGMEMLSDGTRTCDSANSAYDKCLFDYWIENSGKCSLPFFESNKTNTCSTFKEGEMEMKNILSLEVKCLLPCVEFEMEILENPVLYADSQNKSLPYYQSQIEAHLFRYMDTYNGYLVHLPKYLTYRKSSHSYDGISYVAEFAGWAGIFLGISLSGSLLAILQYVQSFKPIESFLQKFIKGIMTLTYVLCMTYIAYLTVTLTLKLLENRLSTSISLEETKVDFAITICATHIIRENESFNGTKYHSLITENLYTEWNKLSSKLSKISIFADGEEYALDPLQLGKASQVNLPLTIGTIDFCHTIDLSSANQIEKIFINVTSEVKIFLHYPGQFIYAWNNWKNVFTSNTKNSYVSSYDSDSAEIYGLDIALTLEKTEFSIEETYQKFDECFLQTLLVNLNDGYKGLIKASKISNFSGKALIKIPISTK